MSTLDYQALDQLARRLAKAEADLRQAQAAAYQATHARDMAREVLRKNLAAQSGAVARDEQGTIYYAEQAPDGQSVNEVACRRLADTLGPLGLAPRTEPITRYPTVTELYKRRRELARVGVRLDDLLLIGPPVAKLRRRARSTAGPA